MQRHVDALLRGEEKYTMLEAAQLAGTSVDLVRRFWLAMGFPMVADEENQKVFTDDDVESMRRRQEMLDSGRVTAETLVSLIRAESHMSDRMVLWQHEAFVEHAERVLGLDGISARFWVLDHFGEYSEFLRDQMDYAWRRHLAALLRRSEAEAVQMDMSDDGETQLQRALGFVDMVAFTNRSNELGAAELVTLIGTFEQTCRDVIASCGARVVKTIGDAFLYIADDVVTGAETATRIVEELRAIPGMLPVRASLVWGGVVSRFGDVFGPTVNLASRLVDVAPTGSVLIDQNTANILRALKLGRYTLVPAGSPDLQGIGQIDSVELRRMPTREASPNF
ncbi:adenylate/guanylate cyclase domain-containing protein [Arcanobacterium haemolyticum]|nr:adenylate/guanylate cyclase domain-containing protein [Arcanobacterium haemolyticum]